MVVDAECAPFASRKSLRISYALPLRRRYEAFGDGAMMVEKLIEQPRHIEAQVLADKPRATLRCCLRGSARYSAAIRRFSRSLPRLFRISRPRCGRECARRWSKLVSGAGYARGAGTVEFIVEPAEGGHFFFLRGEHSAPGPEHPVTEEVTGLDLVAWQLRIADGEALPCGSS